MTTGASTTATSYVYVGLAGETAPGREVQSGLYRMAEGDSEWTMLRHGLPEAPAIRAIAVHPVQPEIVYVGTQSGPYRSTDYGEHGHEPPPKPSETSTHGGRIARFEGVQERDGDDRRACCTISRSGGIDGSMIA
jgi:hypothetical protein